MSAPRAWHRVTAFLGACSITGCILFVSPATGGSACTFAGSSTACGSCIQKECQAEVNACCSDSTCESSVMPTVDSCATKKDDTCETLEKATGPASSPEVALGACVTKACTSECGPAPSTSKTDCYAPSNGLGKLCSCRTGLGTTNTFACSTATYPNTLCCAPVDWPQPGQECDCFPSGCEPTEEGGCICNLVDFSGCGVSATCGGEFCCAGSDPEEGYSCACGPVPCTTGETQVKSCGIEQLRCAKGTVPVASCSVDH
jgi:hypothetical protein